MATLDQLTSTRKLAAILSADVAGYSALMSADEEGTVRKLREVRATVLPMIEHFGGRVIDLAGDGILAEFPSAVRAVECAAELQSRVAELNTNSGPPMLFRIGVNVGDVIHEGERLYGDGINVAARLQSISEPGGICISNKVHEEVRDRVKLAFRDIGEQELKNIARPVRAFLVAGTDGLSIQKQDKAGNPPASDEQKRAGARPVQEIRYCRTPDGVRLAWAKSGRGPPLVKAANWINHLHHDWESPIFEHLFASLGEHRTLYRYDARGNGLSDREVEELSLEAFVSDLETVVEAAALERFPLFGLSQGCAVSIAYAVRHPERVSHLILLSGFAQGDILRSAKEREARLALAALARVGWDAKDPYFREMFAARLFPDTSKEQMRVYAEQQRDTISGDTAARFLETVGRFDVRDLLAEVAVPTLVLQVEGDSVTPLHIGRALASGIPGARFVLLPGRNHVPASGDPAAEQFGREVKHFLTAD
jgi:class 3 adenylate cyclase/pimeloyl-ACP methyl ester carboxylesterase